MAPRGEGHRCNLLPYRAVIMCVCVCVCVYLFLCGTLQFSECLYVLCDVGECPDSLPPSRFGCVFSQGWMMGWNQTRHTGLSPSVNRAVRRLHTHTHTHTDLPTRRPLHSTAQQPHHQAIYHLRRHAFRRPGNAAAPSRLVSPPPPPGAADGAPPPLSPPPSLTSPSTGAADAPNMASRWSLSSLAALPCCGSA